MVRFPVYLNRHVFVMRTRLSGCAGCLVFAGRTCWSTFKTFKQFFAKTSYTPVCSAYQHTLRSRKEENDILISFHRIKRTFNQPLNTLMYAGEKNIRFHCVYRPWQRLTWALMLSLMQVDQAKWGSYFMIPILPDPPKSMLMYPLFKYIRNEIYRL